MLINVDKQTVIWKLNSMIFITVYGLCRISYRTLDSHVNFRIYKVSSFCYVSDHFGCIFYQVRIVNDLTVFSYFISHFSFR
jgi:hypothetical protein